MDIIESELVETPTAAAEDVEFVADEVTAEPTVEAAEEVETDESATDEESSSEAAETEVDTTESFDDLEEIPNADIINAKFNRVSKEAREAMVSYAENWRSVKENLDKVGGETGVGIFAPIASALTKPELTPEEAVQSLTPMFQANADVTSDMIMTGAVALLTNRDPQFKQFNEKGDAILEYIFGDGYTAERLERLVALEKSGYVNADEDYSILQGQGTDSTLFQTQQETINAQKAELTRLQKLVENPHLIEQQTDAVKDLDAELNKRVEAKVTELRERARWKPDSPLTKLVMENIVNTLKAKDAYKNASRIVAKHGKLDSVIPHAVEANLFTLTTEANKMFRELVTAINAESRKRDETSVNTIVKDKVKETTPKAQVIESDRYGHLPTRLRDQLAEIYSRTDSVKVAAR